MLIPNLQWGNHLPLIILYIIFYFYFSERIIARHLLFVFARIVQYTNSKCFASPTCFGGNAWHNWREILCIKITTIHLFIPYYIILYINFTHSEDSPQHFCVVVYYRVINRYHTKVLSPTCLSTQCLTQLVSMLYWDKRFSKVIIKLIVSIQMCQALYYWRTWASLFCFFLCAPRSHKKTEQTRWFWRCKSVIYI